MDGADFPPGCRHDRVASEDRIEANQNKVKAEWSWKTCFWKKHDRCEVNSGAELRQPTSIFLQFFRIYFHFWLIGRLKRHSVWNSTPFSVSVFQRQMAAAAQGRASRSVPRDPRGQARDRPSPSTTILDSLQGRKLNKGLKKDM